MIEKITIKIGGKKIEATKDELRELYADLNELFGVKEPIYYPVYPSPSIPSPNLPYFDQWKITCHDTTGTVFSVDGVSSN